MLCVYPANCTDFSNNGMGVISPSSAIVKETLNGSYELEIVHPYDAEGKWQRLVEGYIVRAPVPSAMTPQVKLAPQTSTSGMVYRVSTNRDPLRLRSGTGTKYKILGKYKKGTQVIVLAKTTSSWYEVTCPDGKHGYMSASYLTYVKTLPAPEQAAVEVVEARQLRDQPFRIYRVVPELNKVTAYARHVFYDLLDNMIKKLEPGSSDTGTTVMQSLSEGCLSEHPFTFYSDLTSTAEEVSFENKNPVDCLLGDGGIIENYGGEIMRDWFDVFVVERVGNDTNIEIRQGKNLSGIKYDVDMTDVTTRIMPTGQDKDGNILYLPEGFVDSPFIENYPFPKWIHLDAMQDATPAVLRIDSSRGTVFKDNNVSTVLSVSVHYGKQIIENLTVLRATFGASAHLQWEWLRMDEDRYGVISTDDTRLSDGGFRLTLGPADVDVKVTFRCALITD